MDIFVKSSAVVLFISLLNPSYAEVYRIVDKEGKVSFSDRSPTELQQQATQSQSVEALDIDRNAHSTDPVIQGGEIKVSMIRLLSQQSYLALNNRLTDYQNKMERNIRDEDQLIQAYQAFQMNDPGIDEHFDLWVATFPASHHPYLARANYYIHQAVLINPETNQQLAEQHQLLISKAERDISQAMHLDNSNLGNYTLMLSAARLRNDHSDMKFIVNQALGFHPASFRIRSDYLLFITPTQGGSYRIMQRVIDEALQQSALNSRLKLLPAYIDYDKGQTHSLKSDYQTADSLFVKALSYGANDIIWQARAINFYKQHKYRKALKAFNRAILINPENSAYYNWRCKTHVQLNQFELAFETIEYADALSPGDDSIKETKNWLASKFKRQGYGL